MNVNLNKPTVMWVPAWVSQLAMDEGIHFKNLTDIELMLKYMSKEDLNKFNGVNNFVRDNYNKILPEQLLNSEILTNPFKLADDPDHISARVLIMDRYDSLFNFEGKRANLSEVLVGVDLNSNSNTHIRVVPKIIDEDTMTIGLFVTVTTDDNYTDLDYFRKSIMSQLCELLYARNYTLNDLTVMGLLPGLIDSL